MKLFFSPLRALCQYPEGRISG
ncbi:hypothetical protein YPPY46_0936, partial [Yersinia pestis PY-46]